MPILKKDLHKSSPMPRPLLWFLDMPQQRRTKTSIVKKAKPSYVRESSSPFAPVQLPSSDIRNVESLVIVKKPHSMTSLYDDPLKNPNVYPDVVTCAKYPVFLMFWVVLKLLKNWPLLM